jgi:hypothetical protein
MGQQNVNRTGGGFLGSVHYSGARIEEQDAPIVRRHLKR